MCLEDCVSGNRFTGFGKSAVVARTRCIEWYLKGPAVVRHSSIGSR